MHSRNQRNNDQLTRSTVNSAIAYNWETNFPSSIRSSFGEIDPKFNILNQYRDIKPNQQYSVQPTESDRFLPEVICSFFGLEQSQKQKQKRIIKKCFCQKTKDGHCQLIIKWIEQQYFWETDPQFHKIYAHYQSKKLEKDIQEQMKNKVSKKLSILGLNLKSQLRHTIEQVLANYLKHALYYNKYDKLIKQSDIYIWVCLGIAFHFGFYVDKNNLNLSKILSFWALDIAMDNFKDLSTKSMRARQAECIKKFQHYYSKWIQFLKPKGIILSDILWEWLNQMMFGYMGVQSIGFFIDRFFKNNWNFLYQVMLSYFEHRSNQIKKSQSFLTNNINKNQFIKLIVNGKQQWPMIFCTASTYVFQF